MHWHWKEVEYFPMTKALINFIYTVFCMAAVCLSEMFVQGFKLKPIAGWEPHRPQVTVFERE